MSLQTSDASIRPHPQLDRRLCDKPWLPAAAAAVLALAAFAVTLGGSFFFDDVLVAREDTRLESPAAAQRFWVSQYIDGASDRLWRPLTSLSFAVQHWTTGTRAWPLHLVNILLHAAAAAAVAEFARRLAGFRVAWIAGLLFAIHPVHVEPVAVLVGRAESGCLLMTFAGLSLYLRPMSYGRALGIAGCFVVAVLCKEQGSLLPPLLLALYPFRRSIIARENSLAASIAKVADVANSELPGEQPTSLQYFGRKDASVLRKTTDAEALKFLAAALLILTATYGVYREQTIGSWWNRGTMLWFYNPLVRSVGIDRVLMPVCLLGRYAALLVAPVAMSPDYTANVIGWKVHAADPYLYIGLVAFFLGTTGFVIALKRRWWAVVFCLLGFGVSYALIGNIVMLIGTIFADRLMYMPSAFFVILAGMLLAKLPGRALAPVMAVVLSLGALRTVTYARQWNDHERLCTIAAQKFPGSWVVYNVLFDKLVERGNYQGARQTVATAIAASPDIPWPYVWLFSLELKLHNFGAARAVIADGKNHISVKEYPWFALEADVREAEKAAATQPAVLEK